MLIFSFRATRNNKKIVFIVFSTLVFLVTLAFSQYIFGSENFSSALQPADTVISNENDIKKFAGNFGLEIGSRAVFTEKIRIPMKFNDKYEEYNQLQKKSGFDLEKFKGCQCVKYTFDVHNVNEKSPVQLNVLVNSNKIIAADVSEKNYNGFMKSIADDVLSEMIQ